MGDVFNDLNGALAPIARTTTGIVTTVDGVLNVVDKALTPVDAVVTTVGTGLVSTVGDVLNVGNGYGTGGTGGSGTPVTLNPPTPPNPPVFSGGGPTSLPSEPGSNPTPPATGRQTGVSDPPGANDGSAGEGEHSADGSNRVGSSASAPIARPDTNGTVPGGRLSPSSAELVSNAARSDALVPASQARLSEEGSSESVVVSTSAFNTQANDVLFAAFTPNDGGTISTTTVDAAQVASVAKSASTPTAAGSTQLKGPGKEVIVGPFRAPTDPGNARPSSPEMIPPVNEEAALANLLQNDLENLERALEQLMRQLGEMGQGVANRLTQFGAVEFLIGLGIVSVACVMVRRRERRRHATHPSVIIGASSRPGPFYLPKGWRNRQPNPGLLTVI